MSNETLWKLIAAGGVIVAAILAGMLGYFTQWRIKQAELSKNDRKEKEKQRLKYYLPLLRSLHELDDRFDRILRNLDSNWLDAEHLAKIKRKEGFAANPNQTGYFIISSVYLIANFFGLTESIKKGVDTTKFSYQKSSSWKWAMKIRHKLNSWFGIKKRLNIFHFDPDITKVCRLFQYEELFREYITTKKMEKPRDACKLHKHIQHSVGEMMLEKDGKGNYRVKSFREFYEAYIADEKFQFWFVLIENLFADLSAFPSQKDLEVTVEMKNDIRPLRIKAIQYWCRILMKNLSSELNLKAYNLQTRPPEAVLNGLSENLRNTITNYSLETTETYLLGIKFGKNILN